MNIKTYTEARAKGVRAIDAYRWATAPAPPELDWQNDERATTERAGFDVRIRIKLDDYTDLSWLGEFTNTDKPNAILSPRRHAPSAFQTAEYFIPAYTVTERRRDLSALGWAKGPAEQEARRQVEQDAQKACEMQEYVILVSIYRENVKLAESALGGVDLGDDWAEARRYVEETADDLIGEAIEEAKETLQKLCKRG